MAGNLLEALAIGGDGVEDATNISAVQEIALPALVVDEGGAGPADPSARFAFVSFEGVNIVDGVSVKPGYTGGALTAAQGLWIGTGFGVILNITGFTHLLHFGTGAVGTVHISPLANQ